MPDKIKSNLLLFSRSVVSDSATLWTAAHQASQSITISQSLFKLMSIERVMLSNRLILCYPLLFCLQSFSALGSFPMSRPLASGGQIMKDRYFYYKTTLKNIYFLNIILVIYLAMPHSMYPKPGLEPVHWRCDVLTTGLPGKSLKEYLESRKKPAGKQFTNNLTTFMLPINLSWCASNAAFSFSVDRFTVCDYPVRC